jgi:hypothetical protein
MYYMFRFNRTIIGHIANVMRFLNFCKKKEPDNGSDESKHVAKCSVSCYTLYLKAAFCFIA